MITRLLQPAYPLNQFIDYFLYHCDYNPEHLVDRFLPEGNIQIVIDLTDIPKYIYHNETLKEIQSCQNVWFSGFRTEPISIPSGKESEMIVIQFKKGKASPFLSEPLQNLTNWVVDAELVVKSEILAIRDKIQNSASPDAKLAALESEFLKFYRNRLSENPFVDYAIGEIVRAPEKGSIAAITRKVGYSQKHMIKIFREQVGVTPKDFLKVIRFQKTIQQIEKNIQVDWSEIAYDCGFYDQSHFIADFKVFSGLTPREYLKKKGDVLNYIPVK